jgi:pyocin large subunit-like protein
MSNAAISWAYKQHEGLNAPAKFVLVALADFADQEHSCYPGISTLMEMTECSRSTVVRSLRTLQDLGLVVMEERRRPNGSSTSNRFWLSVEGAARGGVSVTPPPYQADTPGGVSVTPPEPLDKPSGEPKESTTAVVALFGEQFEEFWREYPRGDGKAAARKAWPKAVKAMQAQLRMTHGGPVSESVAASAIIAGAKAYAGSATLPDLPFRPYGATWLNGERWNDPMTGGPARKESVVDRNLRALREAMEKDQA